MDLNEYQDRALSSAVYKYSGEFAGLLYTILKLNGEAGELAEHVGKAMRDDASQLTKTRKRQMILELGDALWYIAATAKELGWSLEGVASENLEKLAGRVARGTIHGSGSDR